VKWLDRTLLSGPYMCLCLDEKSLHKALKWLDAPRNSWPSFPEYGALTTKYDKDGFPPACIVSVSKRIQKKSLNEIYSFLVHEGAHVWQQLEIYIDEKSAGREIEAYSLQQICRYLMDDYVAQKKKARK
jgi:hypothetical protein